MSLLETAQQKASDLQSVEEEIRRRVREIVRAYRHSWDVYSELIQNSVDAINRRYRVLNDPDFYLYERYRQNFPGFESDQTYRGRIQITIDVPNRKIEVRDNGVGILPARMEEFLLPEGTDKQVGQEYGFKGFGLTFVAFISEEFYLASRPFFPPEADTHEFGLNGLFSWLVDDDDAVPFPSEPIPNVKAAEANIGEDWNTVVRVGLLDDYTSQFPAMSAAEQAIELVRERGRLDGFEFVLRTRTAIGNTRALFNRAPIVPIDIELTVVFSSDDSEDCPIPYLYFHPKEHKEVAVVSYDFHDYFQQYKKPRFTRDFRALYHTVPNQHVGTRRPIKCDFALSAIATRRLSNIEAALGLDKIESGDVGITYGVHLAINGMPTGLRIDDWDTRGAWLKRFYIVVDADLYISNQLDPGRKGISQYYARLMGDQARTLIGETRVGDSEAFSRYASTHLDYGKGPEVGGLPPQDFRIKVAQAREQGVQQQQENTALLNHLAELSHLSCLPTDEQEVIALFYELQTQGVIKGYRTVYLAGSSAVYDAAFDYEIKCNNEENVYPTDPLGIGGVLAQDLQSRGLPVYVHRDLNATQTALPELCVEFKRTVGLFLEEMEHPGRSSKDSRQIDLLIVWDIDIPPSLQDRYTIDPVANNRRIYHGTTHRLGIIAQSTEIHCIVLKEILNKLSEPD